MIHDQKLVLVRDGHPPVHKVSGPGAVVRAAQTEIQLTRALSLWKTALSLLSSSRSSSEGAKQERMHWTQLASLKWSGISSHSRFTKCPVHILSTRSGHPLRPQVGKQQTQPHVLPSAALLNG